MAGRKQRTFAVAALLAGMACSALGQDEFRFGEPSVGRVRDGHVEPSQPRERPAFDARAFHEQAIRRSAIDSDGDGRGNLYRYQPSYRDRSSDRYRYLQDTRGRDIYRYRAGWRDSAFRTPDWRYRRAQDRARVNLALGFSSGLDRPLYWYDPYDRGPLYRADVYAYDGWGSGWADARWRYDPWTGRWAWSRPYGWSSWERSWANCERWYEPGYASAWADPWAYPYMPSVHASAMVMPQGRDVDPAHYNPEGVGPAIIAADLGDHARAVRLVRETLDRDGALPAYEAMDHELRRALVRAIKRYEERSQRDGADADTFLVLAALHVVRGDRERALAALDASHGWGDRSNAAANLRRRLERPVGE